MRYIPLTDADRKIMLEAIGAGSAEELLSRLIPEELRTREALAIGAPLSEKALLGHMATLAAGKPASLVSFCGAGLYDHFIPAAVAPLASRGEFATAYTPYQPEMAQGTLQAAYEYQSLVCLLTGMEVANASMYDGATSCAEAMLMAARLRRKHTFVVSGALHPEYLEVLRVYAGPPGITLIEAPYCAESGRTLPESLTGAIGKAGDDLAGVIVQSPNFFGVIEDWRAVAEAAHGAGALFIATVCEATSLGLLEPPGGFGADIVCGEGQAWGLPMQWGGPTVGLFATKKEYVRQMPGRLVGETLDAEGRRGFVLTLATREQHIRREKATSNICTSQQLCALWVTIWLSLFGKQGIAHVAGRSRGNAEYLKKTLGALPGYRVRFTGPTYNEFVLECPGSAEGIVRALEPKALVPGVALARFYGNGGMPNALLVCATEMRTRAEVDSLATALKEVGK